MTRLAHAYTGHAIFEGWRTMHRVVVTGIGVVSPNGIGRRAFGEAIVEGRSGVSSIESFDTTGLPIKIAGEVKNFDVTPYLGEHKKNAKLMSRAVRFAVGAAALAVEDAGLDPEKLDPARFGVCMGTGITPVDISELVGPIAAGSGPTGPSTWRNLPRHGPSRSSRSGCLQHLPNMAAAHISILHHAMGPNNTIVTACAAGTQAVGEAFRLIGRGDADVMLAGGCDSRLDPQLLVAYSAMKAVSGSLRPAGRGLAPLRRRTRRLRPRRGGRRAGARKSPPRQTAAGNDLCRDHRLRLFVRRLRPDPPRARRQGGGHLHEVGAPRGAGRCCPYRLHQCSRHEHTAE